MKQEISLREFILVKNQLIFWNILLIHIPMRMM